MGDDLFKFCEIKNFKNACLKFLKKVTVISFRTPRIVTDPKLREELIQIYHDCEIIVQKKVCAKLRREFYWTNFSRDVSKYIRNCKDCIVNKPERETIEELAITPTPQKPTIDVVDTIGPMQKTDLGNRYAVTIMCDIKKFLITVAVPNNEANTIARAILENCILIFGQFKSIVEKL